MALGLLHELVGRPPCVVNLRGSVFLVRGMNHELHTLDWRVASGLERAAVLRADAVTSLSQVQVDVLRLAGWLRDRPVAVVRHPVPVDPWAAVPPADGTAPVILAAGLMQPLKRPVTVVEAAALLRDEIPDLEVHFVGRPSGRWEGRPHGDWLRDRAAALGVRCRFFGEVPRPQMRDRYAEARVVAVASVFEPGPNVGMEAMASGRPVVASSRTGVAELIAGTDVGAVVPPENPRAMAAALRPFLLDARLARASGERGTELVRKDCDPDRIAGERESIYQVVIESRRRGRRRSALQ